MINTCPSLDNRYQPAIYKPRRPAETVFYQIIQENLEQYLHTVREETPDDDPIPGYVEKEFYKYLDCGLLSKGFARVYCDSCHHEYLLPFSCKAKSLCPSCTSKNMARTAAFLVDNVIPRVPVRQWVLSVPKRIRYYLHRDKKIAGAVLRIFLRAVETTLFKCSPGAPSGSKGGSVSFVHRFGASLNAHCHFHCLVIDGQFHQTSEEELAFVEVTDLTIEDIQSIGSKVRRRILKYFERHDILDSDDVENMLQWEHNGGFSIDASVRIESWDRNGLEQLLRYCARPPFAMERLKYIDDNKVVYQLKKPTVEGFTAIIMTPMEFINRLCQIITPPYTHRHRFHGVLAPNSAWRKKVIASAGPAMAMLQQMQETKNQIAPSAKEEDNHDQSDGSNNSAKKEDAEDLDILSTASARFCYTWAMLIARIYEVLPLICPHCGEPMRIISFITQPETVTRILDHIGEETEPPQIRAPPDDTMFTYY